MRIFIPLIIMISLTNCSLNKNSKFWTEDVKEKKLFQNDYEKIKVKSNDVMSMTYDEYEIFISVYSESNNYPDITK